MLNYSLNRVCQYFNVQFAISHRDFILIICYISLCNFRENKSYINISIKSERELREFKKKKIE